MKPLPTRLLSLDPLHREASLQEAARVLREGGLAAFPTETVYGLGACATNSEAVQAIYAAKGRPSRNPLIVHVAAKEAALPLVSAWPEAAELLAVRFWPGPLTLVLPRSPLIPDAVTGGGDTVGVRVPAHPDALQLLQKAEVPVAAPSANRSNGISPTSAQHVMQHLNGRIALVLDGGQTPGGIESTVLDLTAPAPVLLRPGLLSVSEIESCIGTVVRTTPQHAADAALPAPGMMARHYAPRASLLLASPENALRLAEKLLQQGAKPALLTMQQMNAGEIPLLCLSETAEGYAALLYSALHTLDAGGATHIVAVLPPEAPEWEAVRDRLMRASTPETQL